MHAVIRFITILIFLFVSATGLRAQELPPLLPLFDYPVRDTSVCLGPDGTYYLTGTTGAPTWWSSNDGIRMWKSMDRVTWQAMGLVWSFAQDKTWQQPGAIWAPSIRYLKGTFWLAYSMNYGGTGLLKSTSGNPEGPYVDIKTDGPLTSDIDAGLFEDDDGKVYFVYQNGMIARMNDTMTGLAETPRLLSPANGGQVGFEGAFIVKMGSKYLLGCAVFNNDSGTSTYDCMVASADNIYGPYSDRYLAIRHGGHNEFFQDPTDNWWSTFFGNDGTSPFTERPAILRIEMNAQGRIQSLGQPLVTTNTVQNPSFESPSTASYNLTVANWTKVGTGLMFTAVVNNSSQYGGITGITGSQFGDIDGARVGTALYQDLTGLTYSTGASYTLTVDVATRPDNKVKDTSNLRLSLMDSSTHMAAFTNVLGSQVNAIGKNVATFTVNLPAVLVTDAWANQTIRIRFEDTFSGGTGDWVVDNVRLTAATATTTTLASSLNPSAVGQNVTFTATIAPPSGAVVPTGTVQFKIDGTDFGAPVAVTTGSSPNGTATSSGTSALAVGNHAVTAAYAGTGVFTNSSGTLAGGQTVITFYAAWANSHSFANPFTDNAPTSDPDGDGLSNQQEFAFGLDPTTGSSVNPITVPLSKTGTFSYTRYAHSGLTYTVWTAPDLQTWAIDPDASQDAVTGLDDISTVSVTLRSPPSGTKLFVRVAAE